MLYVIVVGFVVTDAAPVGVKFSVELLNSNVCAFVTHTNAKKSKMLK